MRCCTCPQPFGHLQSACAKQPHSSSVCPSSSRGVAAYSSERGPVLESTIRGTPNQEGRDMLRTEQPPKEGEQKNRYQHLSQVVPSTAAHQGVQDNRPGRGTSSPRLRGGPQANPSGPQEAGAGESDEVTQNAVVPGEREGLGEAFAPAFGGDLQAQEDTRRRDKVRWGKSVRHFVVPSNGGDAADLYRRLSSCLGSTPRRGSKPVTPLLVSACLVHCSFQKPAAGPEEPASPQRDRQHSTCRFSKATPRRQRVYYAVLPRAKHCRRASATDLHFQGSSRNR